MRAFKLRHLAISTPSLASQICFLLLEAPFAYAHFEVLGFFQRLSSSCVSQYPECGCQSCSWNWS